jgi:hypothetical protein
VENRADYNPGFREDKPDDEERPGDNMYYDDWNPSDDDDNESRLVIRNLGTHLERDELSDVGK